MIFSFDINNSIDHLFIIFFFLSVFWFEKGGDLPPNPLFVFFLIFALCPYCFGSALSCRLLLFLLSRCCSVKLRGKM
jgi:hypothetical protein